MFTLYQKPVIDHCPWPSSQFNNWQAQNKLLSSSLIVAALGSTPPHTSEPLSPQGLFYWCLLVFLQGQRIRQLRFTNSESELDFKSDCNQIEVPGQ
jgi:hypothetical protein